MMSAHEPGACSCICQLTPSPAYTPFARTAELDKSLAAHSTELGSKRHRVLEPPVHARRQLRPVAELPQALGAPVLPLQQLRLAGREEHSAYLAAQSAPLTAALAAAGAASADIITASAHAKKGVKLDFKSNAAISRGTIPKANINDIGRYKPDE